MKTTFFACGLAVGLALGPTWAQAQTVSWSEAVDGAWRRTTAAAESAGQLRRADATRKVADALWAAPPALELSHRDDRIGSNRGARETEIGIVVPVWMPGQRGAQRIAAQAGREAAESTSRAHRWQVAGTVLEAAWAITLERSEVDGLRTQSDALAALAADVDRRVGAGELARADALAARAEALAADNLRSQAQQRLDSAMLSWTALTGLNAAPSADFTPPSPASADHPALQAAAASVEAARRRVDAIKSSRRSAPELIARVRQDTSGRGEGRDQSVGLALRIPFGTDDRNAPLLAGGLTELDVAEATERQLRARLEADIAIAERAVRAAQTQLDAERQRAKLLRERSELVQRSFRAGETALPETLRTLAAAQQAQANAQRQHTALGLARARLQHAQGVTP